MTDAAFILERMRSCAANPRWDDLSHNLLHAYAACLEPTDLCEVALQTLNESTDLRRPVRNRLVRLGREGCELSGLDALGRSLLKIDHADARHRVRIDALLSHLYAYFGPATRQSTLERWREHGTVGSIARWVKAIADDDVLFDAAEVFGVWRNTHHARTAWLLAKRGDPAVLARALPELAERVDEGWTVSRAILRADQVSDEVWNIVRVRFPATYAYACAKSGRPCSDTEAISLIEELDGDASGERGLAIWAVGEMKQINVLEHFHAKLSKELMPLTI